MHPFEILAEPVRRRIIEILAVGEHAVGIINDVISLEFDVSRSAVSHHLRILRDEHVVTVEPDAAVPQSRLYRLDETFLERLDEEVDALFVLQEHRYGIGVKRAPVHPAPRSRMPRNKRVHRAGGKGRRGRTPFSYPDPDPDLDTNLD